MEVSLRLADEIDPVAVYAAIVATLVFCWQMYVWFRSGPRFRLHVQPNMQRFVGMQMGKQKYVLVDVANVGGASATITNVVLYGFNNWIAYLRQRPDFQAEVNDSIDTYPIPYVLEPGHRFASVIGQDENLEGLSRNLMLYAGIFHSGNKRPVISRIKPIER